MNISDSILGVLLLSAVAFGLGVFFIDVSTTYGVDASQLGVLETTFSQDSAINSHLNSLKSVMTNFQVINPLSYLQFASSLVLTIFDIPVTIMTIVNAAAAETFLIPPWSVVFIEALVLASLVLAGIKLLATGGGQI